MQWTPGYKSNDVEDRRGQSSGGGGGGLGLLFGLFARFGVPGLLVGGVLLFVVPRFLGGTQEPAAASATQETEVQFVSFVLDDVQQTWQRRFAADGHAYRPAKLVLFSGQTGSGCGYGDAAVGPFYCPVDQHVYIDLSFYDALKKRFGAPGEFAQAYVIAHEMGHHVQHQLGLDKQTGVRLELQADCLAGVWANDTEHRKLLDPGDIGQALTAAAAIGDDKIQRDEGRTVRPETWTHGSSEQRVKWFGRGYHEGTLSACDTSLAI